MSVIRARRDEILRRRELVASLRARRLTVRAIREAIVGMKDATGAPMFKPVTFGAIQNDLMLIRADMNARAIESMESWRAQELADIEEVEAAAWREKRLDLVLKAKERKHKILGLDAPTKTDLTSAGERVTFIVERDERDTDTPEALPPTV